MADTASEALGISLERYPVGPTFRRSQVPGVGTPDPTTTEGAKELIEKLRPFRMGIEEAKDIEKKAERGYRQQERDIQGAVELAKAASAARIAAKEPMPTDVPTFVAPKKTMDELLAVLMLGMAGRGKAADNYYIAAGSMIGAMEGYQKGDKERYERSVKEYDIALKKAVQDDKRALAAYRQVAAQENLNLNQKLQQYYIIAKQAGHEAVAAAARAQDLETVSKTVDAEEKRMQEIIRKDAERQKNAEQARELRREGRANRQAQIDAARLTGRTAQTWEVTDEQGKKRNISVMPQYDRQGRQTNEPAGGVLLGTGARAGTTTGGGAANNRYAFNINESFSQAAQDLLNVSQMPSNTVLGAFAGMTGRSGDSLATALRNNLARTVTPADTRMMQQIVAGLDQNMARALGGGYASSTSKGLIEAYKEQVAQYGDSPFAQAMFLSRMKQELGILAKAFKNHPGSNEGYVRDMKEYMDSLNEAIPFNVSDVISTVRGQRPTVTQKFSRVIQTPSRLSLPALGSPVTADERTGAEQAPATAAPSGPAASRAPEGVPQEVWNAMTPQERALWPR